MTLGEKIEAIMERNPEQIVTLATEKYGDFWTGRVKFVWSAVSLHAWRSKNIIVKEG